MHKVYGMEWLFYEKKIFYAYSTCFHLCASVSIGVALWYTVINTWMMPPNCSICYFYAHSNSFLSELDCYDPKDWSKGIWNRASGIPIKTINVLERITLIKSRIFFDFLVKVLLKKRYIMSYILTDALTAHFFQNFFCFINCWQRDIHDLCNSLILYLPLFHKYNVLGI
jgi:hypothetical protein